MNNAMDGLRLQSMYDLKGSTSKRTANAGDQCEGKFKDNDWNAAGMKLFLPAFTRGKVLEAITRDAQFLRSKNIMDHSLLVSHDSVPVYCTPQGIEMDADGRGGQCVSAKHQPHKLVEPVDLRFHLTDMFYPEIPLSTPDQRIHCCPLIPEHGEALNGPIGSYIEKYSMIAGNLRRNDIRFQKSKQRMEELDSAEVEKLKMLSAVDSNVCLSSLTSDPSYTSCGEGCTGTLHIFCLSIMDFLQNFNRHKQFESRIKNVQTGAGPSILLPYRKEGRTSSVQDPEFYRERFVDFISKQLQFPEGRDIIPMCIEGFETETFCTTRSRPHE
jgi:hypothetical protein